MLIMTMSDQSGGSEEITDRTNDFNPLRVYISVVSMAPLPICRIRWRKESNIRREMIQPKIGFRQMKRKILLIAGIIVAIFVLLYTSAFSTMLV